MIVADLQSWAKCYVCGTILWIAPSIDEQRAVCRCGQVTLHEWIASGTIDTSFNESDMQIALDSGRY